jgi:hypothetical protein
VTNPLNASASTSGALMSSSVFEIPPFQREYSWRLEQVTEFWLDLKNNINRDTYFLGLVILTESEEEDDIKVVVDGQQRLLTLSLLAIALYYEAYGRGRKALADRIQADFLRSIDYDTDETDPRVSLSDSIDNETYEYILENGRVPRDWVDDDSTSSLMCKSFLYISKALKEDLGSDPFKKLGKWTDFLTHRVYFAVFLHPDAASAYQVFEVINTRGRELTTADLLKNYVLSVTPKRQREARYHQWQAISRQFSTEGSNNFVQFIRHAVTVQSGHILPKDLYAYLSGRPTSVEIRPPSPDELMEILEKHLPLYLQMIDPSAAGPAEAEALNIFAALNSLGVIAVRPIMLAMAETDNSLEGLRYLLRLVVRRIVVGNLGTGNVERKFGEAALEVFKNGDWKAARGELKDLNPASSEFFEQLRKRSFNKAVLSFLRQSVIQRSITPKDEGALHFIWVKQADEWEGITEEEGSFWGSTIGNTFLSSVERRPKGALTWDGFQETLLPTAVQGEFADDLQSIDEWDAEAIEGFGTELAGIGTDVWYK